MASIIERDMNRHQRGMVDTCFEEGHYEAGISVLDKLRAPHVMPSPSHIRQLIYISLFPPPTPADSAREKGKGKEKDSFGSPSKVPSTKQSKTALLPSPSASDAALNLLISFALTNSAAALLRAMPSYPPIESDPNARQNITAFESVNQDESFTAKESGILKECRDCWDMLKSGVVKRKETPPRKQRGRQKVRGQKYDYDDAPEEATEEEEDICAVGTYSWPLLDWLLRVFEKEESLNENHYSLSLLSQIKPPRSSSGPRSDVDAPVEIIFTCFQQSDSRRRDMGARLMSLMINLTQSPYFSPQQFIPLTTSRLRSLDLDALNAFLSKLPADRRGLAFKLAICEKYLTDSGSAILGTKPAPKPQARRARPLNACPQRKKSSSSPSKPHIGPSTFSYPWLIPGTARIQQFLDASTKPAQPSMTHFYAMFHMLLTFGNMRAREFYEINSVDPSWIKLLEDPALVGKLRSGFTLEVKDEILRRKLAVMAETLVTMVQSWKLTMVKT